MEVFSSEGHPTPTSSPFLGRTPIGARRPHGEQAGPGPTCPQSGELAYLLFNFCQRFDGDSQEIKGLHLQIQIKSSF